MFSIASIASSAVPRSVEAVWKDVAESVAAWLQATGAAPRDAVLLLPQVRHLPSARQAWSRWVGGWLPRIETPQTLSAAWAPTPQPVAGLITFDLATDHLTARKLLQSASFTRASDPLALDHALTALVQTAQGMARAASLVPPTQRDAHWARCRECLNGAGGPAGRERALAQLALEWAALQVAPRTDVLFLPDDGEVEGEAARVSAWVMVQAGGVDPLSRAVLQAAALHRPCGVVDLDGVPNMAEEGADTAMAAAADAPLPCRPQALKVAVCEDFEEEAQRSAAQVLHHLTRREVPVVLVAQDRVLVRRVQALLTRRAVAVQDETGWKLSTTTAAAMVMAWLRAMRPQASLDEVIDALKSVPHRQAEVQALEAVLRRRNWRRLDQVQPARLPPAAAMVWQDVLALRASVPRGLRPLTSWLDWLAGTLHTLGLTDALAQDAAGTQVLAALRLSLPDVVFGEMARSLGGLDLPQWMNWIDQTLEQASFVPPVAAQAEVVITPLSHAVLRPFAAAVFPGADATHWGPPAGLHPLLTPAQAQVFGLPTQDGALAAQWLSMRQLTRVPQLTLLHRLNDVDERLLPSPLLERLLLLWNCDAPPDEGVKAPEVRVVKRVPPAPVHPAGVAAPGLLPSRLSASACEALRACPYRFFALRMLQLQSVEELETNPDKRDYGDWLHTVLLRFHTERTPGTERESARASLRRVARASQSLQGWDDAEFLPYLASFERLINPYLDWLEAREAQGIHWLDGEREVTAWPPAWDGVAMHGIIDRLDRLDGPTPTLELIDYKTGSATALKQKVNTPSEETQLAFYAALMRDQAPAEALQAAYLPLEDGHRLKAVPHPDLEHSAERLVAGIGQDLARLRGGAALWPLGQGNACDYCAARGVCRRDHWVGPVPLPVTVTSVSVSVSVSAMDGLAGEDPP